jgi:hypothetical protein
VFQQAFTDVLSRLDTAKLEGLVEALALIGGFAMSAWGVQRPRISILPLPSAQQIHIPSLPCEWWGLSFPAVLSQSETTQEATRFTT